MHIICRVCNWHDKAFEQDVRTHEERHLRQDHQLVGYIYPILFERYFLEQEGS